MELFRCRNVWLFDQLHGVSTRAASVTEIIQWRLPHSVRTRSFVGPVPAGAACSPTLRRQTLWDAHLPWLDMTWPEV